ncbi:MAG: extracellular solute-binding protein [Spirochaetes bacterium]|nr:extracellular solute-binding protein [Spirochaetota bacterium]
MGGNERLRILALKHVGFDATLCIRDEIERRIGIPVSIDYIHDEWEMYEESKRRITRTESVYDLFMVDSIWIYEYAALGMLASLDELFSTFGVPDDYEFSDLIPEYVDHYCRVDGTLYCLPLAGHTNFLAYRKDLFEKSGLKPPATQKELLECSKLLTKNGVYGITLRGKGFELAYTYMLFLYPNGRCVLDETCTPRLLDPVAIDTLEYLQRLWRYTPPDVLEYSFVQMADAFRNGAAALYHDASVGAILVRDCPISDRFGYALAPSGIEMKTSVAGWGLGIPFASSRKREALSWILSVTGKRHAGRMLRAGQDPVRISTLKDETLLREYPFLAAISDNLRHATPWFRPPIPPLAEALDILGHEISAVLKKKRTPKQGLQSAQERILVLLEREGYG